MTMDDGADIVFTVHTKRQELLPGIFAGTEETTTGVIRLKAMAKDGVLKYPIIAVNDAMTKYLFDNRYGTGQSTLDGILRATNRLMSGSIFVVAGYGWCGRGLAMRARGMGARVVVTEVDPLKGLEAIMDGYEVLPMAQAAKIGDIFCTLTGDINVIREEHFQVMKDGAILSNSGHFNVEIDIDALTRISTAHRPIRDFVEEYTLKNGKLHLPAGRRPPGEPGRGRRASFRGHGHELRQPGPGLGIHLQEPRQLPEAGLPGAGSHRQRDRPPEAGGHAGGYRHPDAGAGKIPGLLRSGYLEVQGWGPGPCSLPTAFPAEARFSDPVAGGHCR